MERKEIIENLNALGIKTKIVGVKTDDLLFILNSAKQSSMVHNKMLSMNNNNNSFFLVEFLQDFTPYKKGEIVKIHKEIMKKIDRYKKDKIIKKI
jgi:hypothetical protein